MPRATFLPQMSPLMSRRGRIFYFDATGGDDSNTGLTIYDPLKTIGKYNAMAFLPSDTIKFKCGETFPGRMQPTFSGYSGSWITHTSYGTGARPIIDGSASVGALLITSSYHYLRFENIDFSGSTGTTYGTVTCQTSYAYFQNCVFRDSAALTGFNGFDWVASGAIVFHVTLDTCIIRDNYRSGVNFGSALGTLGPHDVLITHCTAYNNGHVAFADHGIYLRHGGIIEYCVCYDNPVGAGIKVNCEGVVTSPYTPIVRYNTCYGNMIGLYIDNVHALVHDNLVYENTDYGFFSGQCDDCILYHNTFVNETAGANGLITLTQSDVQNMIWKNNTFVQDAAVWNIEIFRLTTNTAANFGADNTLDYNSYYHNVGGTHGIIYESGSSRDWAYWQAAGMEAHGTLLTALPAFATRYTDLRPADGGNLKGTGIAIAGYEIDLDGKTRLAPISPGCYDRILSGAPTVSSIEIGTNGKAVLDVLFSRYVFSSDFAAGVDITINAVSVGINSAIKQGDGVTVRYTLDTDAIPPDTVLWSFDADVGDIEEIDGAHLADVTDHAVTNNTSLQYLAWIDFETGDTSQASFVQDPHGDITVGAAAAMRGSSYGGIFTISDADEFYLQSNPANKSTGTYNARFYLKPNGLTMADADEFVLLILYNSAIASMATVKLLYTAGIGYRVFARLYNDAGGTHTTGSYTITDAEHCIEIGIVASPTDGSLKLYIDDSLQETISGKDTDTRCTTYAFNNWGVIAGAVPAGTSGAFHMDELVITWDGVKIGA